MNILLLYPEMPSSFWSMDHTLKIIGKGAWYPPLNLLTVAAMLPDTWTRRLIDLNVDPLQDEDIQWADHIFLTAMNVQERSVLEIIERCNRLGANIVAGGSLFTLEHARFSGIDHFVLNEAEITLPLFLADLERGEPQKLYTSDTYANIQQTPTPAWDLIDLDRYQYGIIQYSRGCPFHCDFCDVPGLYGNNPRTKTSAQVIAELDVIYDSSTVPSILFADDNLIGNKKALKNDLLPALIEWRHAKVPPFSFSTQVSINLADDEELMDLILEAGFRHIFIGIETDSEETLTQSKKSQNTQRNVLDNISLLHRKGFVIVGGFIVGFDTDTVDTFQDQVNLIQESGILLATVNMLKAPPGTPLFERMKSAGRLVEGFSFEESQSNIVPLMPARVMVEGFKRMINQLYGPELALQRAKKWLAEFNHLPTVKKDIPGLNPLKYLPVLFRAVYHVMIRYEGSRQLWQLIFWTLRHRPRLIDWAFVECIGIYQLHHLLKEHTESLDRQLELLEAEEPVSS